MVGLTANKESLSQGTLTLCDGRELSPTFQNGKQDCSLSLTLISVYGSDCHIHCVL